MSTASPSLPSSDPRLKWQKRRRESNPKRQDDDEDDEDADAKPNGNVSPAPARAAETEVISDAGHRISTFPAAVRRTVNRPHPSILALFSPTPRSPPPFLENISHGQLQALPYILPDNPSLLHPPDPDRPSAYVCSPPPLMDGRGVAKRLSPDRLLVVPFHSDWFSPASVHRLERQVVPHFFSGKSTPERYITLRNKIVSKYMENPDRRLSLADCQGLVASGELYDLSRIVRFLDHWGIINYLAASSLHRGLRMAPSLVREDANGELQLQTSPLRSMDSLILFDRLKCSLRMDDVALLAGGSSSSARLDSEGGAHDLDARIRERLSEYSCSYCSCPLPSLHYQSQKEADVILCSDCFHDAKFITGHSSVDFVRVNSQKYTPDIDGDGWTDQETLLLLEALEKYNDNWNEIAEHVGTKSKAQCILHFVRLPMEDGLLENIEVPSIAGSADSSKGENLGLSSLNSNGDAPGCCLPDLDSRKQLPFANSVNPVMSLVAFLASAIGPRVAAACASASLSVLTKGDPRSSSESPHTEVGNHGAHANSDENSEEQVGYIKKDAVPTLEHVKEAAMCGLSAAAMKSKLFADQEEREIQRQAASIINHQLKRLELKLKQFAEVETLLLKECEQVERTRHRLSAERARMMSILFGSTGPNLPAAAGGVAAAAATSTSTSGAGAGAGAPSNTNARQITMTTSVGQPNITSSYANNLPGHPHMQFAQRQQMFGFGPRLPLSAIHPSPSASSQNVFTSGMANASTPNHQSLRSSSGNNTHIG